MSLKGCCISWRVIFKALVSYVWKLNLACSLSLKTSIQCSLSMSLFSFLFSTCCRYRDTVIGKQILTPKWPHRGWDYSRNRPNQHPKPSWQKNCGSNCRQSVRKLSRFLSTVQFSTAQRRPQTFSLRARLHVGTCASHFFIFPFSVPHVCVHPMVTSPVPTTLARASQPRTQPEDFLSASEPPWWRWVHFLTRWSTLKVMEPPTVDQTVIFQPGSKGDDSLIATDYVVFD